MGKPHVLNTKMTTVLVCGSRRWKLRGIIFRELAKLDSKGTIIVNGGARGADTIADQIAKELEFFCVITFPAWWNTQGGVAGPIRNQRMLEWARPDLVLAFHEDPGLGKGTKNMVELAQREDISVKVFNEQHQVEEGEEW